MYPARMSGWLISDLRRGPRFVLCASDGTISSEFFKDREPPPPNKFKSIPVLGAKMQQTKTKLVNVQAETESSHVVLRNLKKSAGEEQAHLTAAIGRMASADAEVATMMESMMSMMAPLESLLGPTERVLAKLKCVGFDGFPDFGAAEQQRIGQCSVALIGSEKDPHVPTRMVFTHRGQKRSIEADENLYELPLISAKSNTSSWSATREQASGLAAIHVTKQLIGITSDNIEKVALHKVSRQAIYRRSWCIDLP